MLEAPVLADSLKPVAREAFESSPASCSRLTIPCCALTPRGGHYEARYFLILIRSVSAIVASLQHAATRENGFSSEIIIAHVDLTFCQKWARKCHNVKRNGEGVQLILSALSKMRLTCHPLLTCIITKCRVCNNHRRENQGVLASKKAASMTYLQPRGTNSRALVI